MIVPFKLESSMRRMERAWQTKFNQCLFRVELKGSRPQFRRCRTMSEDRYGQQECEGATSNDIFDGPAMLKISVQKPVDPCINWNVD